MAKREPRIKTCWCGVVNHTPEEACRVCRTITSGPHPHEEHACLEGLSRMAHARQGAGLELSELDREALGLYPDAWSYLSREVERLGSPSVDVTEMQPSGDFL